MLRSPVDEGSNASELVHAVPSIQPSASQDQANLQHGIGRHRHGSPDDGEGCGPVEDSIAGHGQDDDVTQPPRKRREIRTSAPTTRGTVLEPRTRLHRAGQAQRRTTQRPKPRRSQCPSDVPEDQGQQREGGSVAPPQAQEVQANAEPSMPPPASQVGVKRQHDLSRHRHCSTDDGEDCCPSVCSDTEHREDDAVRPRRRKRRRVSAATHTAGQPLSSRHVRTVATLREKLGDHPGARGANAALPIRHRHESPLWKGTPRRTEPLLQRSKNGPLETRSSSALQ